MLSKLTSPLLHLAGSYERAWRRSTGWSLVLCYHRVVANPRDNDGLFNVERGVPAERFALQIQHLLRHFTPVAADRVADADAGRPRFAVTFDDGYLDNLTIAAPILHRLGVPATIFTVSDRVGTDQLFWWEQLAEMLRRSPRQTLDGVDRILPGSELPARLQLIGPGARERAHEVISAGLLPLPQAMVDERLRAIAVALETDLPANGRRFPLADWAQLRSARDLGITVGAHSRSHANLAAADEAAIADEVDGSLAATTAALGDRPMAFAYPYGANGPAARRAVQRAGFTAAFTTEPGVARAGSDPGALPRVQLNRRWPFAWNYQIDRARRVA